MKKYSLIDTISGEWYGDYSTLEDTIDTVMCLKEREYCIYFDYTTLVMTVDELKKEIKRRWDEYETSEGEI